MRVWRLTRLAHSREPLSGQGAARSGNRWNSPGLPMVYTSTSRPLAVLEMLLHVTRDTVPSHLVLIPIEVEDGSIAEATGLPRDWNQLPYSARARRIGDEWARANRSLALLVPSVVLPSEKNLLINPLHPDLPGVWVLPPEAFQFDRRLLR